jgi:hypothetical protein
MPGSLQTMIILLLCAKEEFSSLLAQKIRHLATLAHLYYTICMEWALETGKFEYFRCMKKPVVALFICSLWMARLDAQRPLGTWRTFLPYSSAIQVTQSSDRIYCATPYSLFYVEKADGSTVALTKSDGLSDVDVRHIAYNQPMNTLVITYANSNIDLLVNGTDIYNIPDIKNAIVNSSKNINDIACIGNYAYLATDVGISVLDLGQQQIMDNYSIGETGGAVKVTSIASDGISIFAATSEGLKSAPLSSQNLQDYNSWTVYGESSGLPAGASTLVGQTGSIFYAVVADSLYRLSGSTFTKVRSDTAYNNDGTLTDPYVSFSSTNGNLYLSVWTSEYSAKVIQMMPDSSLTDLYFSNSVKPEQLTIDGNTIWIADEWNSLTKYNNQAFVENVFPAGPPGNSVFRMAVSDHVLYMAAGGTDPGYLGYNYNNTGPVVYNQYDWKNYSPSVYGSIAGCLDLVDVAVDPVHQKAYWASLQGGLVEMDLTNNNVTNYNQFNSILSPCGCDAGFTKISALCLDQSGNLWMSNTGTPQTLVVKTVDSGWAKFTVPNDLSTVRKMMVDANGYVWMGGRGNNMVVYNPGQSLTGASDDQFVALTTATGSGALSNNDIWTIVPDNEGNVWVGTDVGISTFYCASGIFATGGGVGCDATLIKVDQGGYIGYLFSTQIVQALAVDGADRKWVGTTNGVWLISADGTQQLLQFNTENSPLPNNSITDIEVDQQTGEVWIGTADGLVSYQGDAILGGSAKGTALVYPNPVRSDYTGPIAIKGLVENAYVKITDASGILVYQGQANGGQMIWNGQGYSGNKVSSGIYMVYADASDGSQHNVGKIIFMK